MYRKYDSVNCIPSAFYRTPEAIKRDIGIVIERIGQINDLLNIRELVATAMDNEERPIRYAEAMDELSKYAEEAKEELLGLCESLDALKSEFVTSVNMLS